MERLRRDKEKILLDLLAADIQATRRVGPLPAEWMQALQR